MKPTSSRQIRRFALAAAAVMAVTCATACAPGRPDAGDDAPVTVTLWDQKGGDASELLDEMVSDFNESQDEHTLERQFIAGSADQFASQIQNAVRTGDTPNLVFGDSNAARIGALVETESIEDLTSYFGTGDYPLEKDDIFPGMMEPSTFGGKVYSLPSDGGAFALIYNSKAFDEAGISSAPSTWDDVAKAAAKLTTKGSYGIYLPIGASEWTSFTWQAMLWSAGGEFLNDENTRSQFDSPEGIKALATWTDMVKKGHAYPSSLDDDSQQTGINGFIAGQVAMFIGRPADLAILDEALGADVAQVLPFPSLEKPAMNTGTNVSYIFSGTADENAGAWAFLSWAMQPQQQAKWDIGTGYLPTNVHTAESSAWKEHIAADERVSVFVDQLSHARARPAIPQYSAVSSALASQIELAMLQKITPDEALAAAAQKADEALRE